ncbi:uncharacterized [Tachysurus ichikawai]
MRDLSPILIDIYNHTYTNHFNNTGAVGFSYRSSPAFHYPTDGQDFLFLLGQMDASKVEKKGVQKNSGVPGLAPACGIKKHWISWVLRTQEI